MLASIPFPPPARTEMDALDRYGFVVLPSPWSPPALDRLTAAYDEAVRRSDASERRASESIRVHGLVHAGSVFAPVYTWEPLLVLSFHLLAEPFKLITLLARSLLPGSRNQVLHRDYQRQAADEPCRLVGFIVPLDDFCSDNGATRFVPGSHTAALPPEAALLDPRAEHPDEVLALDSR